MSDCSTTQQSAQLQATANKSVEPVVIVRLHDVRVLKTQITENVFKERSEMHIECLASSEADVVHLCTLCYSLTAMTILGQQAACMTIWGLAIG